MYVFGKLGSASFLALTEIKLKGFGGIEDVDGATKYARPCRPVKPLLMIWLERARSERQLAQRRWAAWPDKYDSALGGLLPGLLLLPSLDVVAVLSVLDCRRRKGREGTR